MIATNHIRYDVFLSHSSADIGAAEAIADYLRTEADLRPFLDRWHLTAGMPWQDELQEALKRSATVAVLVGSSGFNPWHHEEMRVALNRAVGTHDEFRVIPVLLPGADPASLPSFLSQRTWVDFRSGLGDMVALRRLAAGVRGEAVADGVFELPSNPAPYRGLLPYTREDADLFFGRDSDIDNLITKLRSTRFVAVVGASGSGKSSLVRAGLLPALDEGSITGSSTWNAVVLSPGPDPMRSLAEQVATLDAGSDRIARVDQLTERFTQRADGLQTSMGALTAEAPRTTLIVVDQFEELFASSMASPTERREQAGRFVENLANAILEPGSRCRVVITLRADFVDRALSIPQLKELLQDRQVLLSDLDTVALRDVIVRPAQAVGAFFEKGLVQTIVQDVEEKPGALPLLQHALYELWQRRTGPWLTIDAYEESGGVAGALHRRAQATYDGLSSLQQALTRTILLRLTSLGEGVLDTRRRVKRVELYPVGADSGDVNAVIDALSAEEARLIVVDRDTAQITHEALIQQWDTLRDWLADDREALRVHRRLTQSAEEWASELGRDPGALYRGAKLAETVEWASDYGGELNVIERDFLDASRRRAADELDAERGRSRRLKRRLLAAVAALIVAMIGVVGALWALDRAIDAEANATVLAAEARARELAVSSRAALDGDPQLAALLAVEATNVIATQGASSQSVSLAALYDVAMSPLRHRLTGHEGRVLSAVFSPDGSRILTASADGTARVYDRLGTSILTLSHDIGTNVWSAVFSPDGTRILTASGNGTAKVWGLDGTLRATLSGHTDSVYSAVFSPNGGRILTASFDGTARVWELDGTLVTTVSGHTDRVWSAVFDPEGNRIVTASADGTARVWDTGGTPLATLSGHVALVGSAVFSPDGSRIVTASDDGTAKVWDTDGTLLTTLSGHTEYLSSARFGPDGSRIVTASDDGTAKVWDTDGTLLATLSGHTDTVWSAMFSPNGGRILTASFDGTARVWDLDGTLLSTLSGHTDKVWSAMFSPSGNRVLTAGEDFTARISDPAGSPLFALVGHTETVMSADFSPNGNRILTFSTDGTARVWRLDGALLSTLTHDGTVWSAMFSPDGNRILTAGDDGSVHLSALDGTRLATLSHEGAVWSAMFSPDGNRILTATAHGPAQVWDLDGTIITNLRHDAGVRAAVFSPDGNRIATDCDDGSVRVWDLDGTLIATLSHDAGVRAAVFSPDSSQIATVGDDDTARVWDVEGTLIASLSGHADRVILAMFSPDGTQIVTGSADATARVWDLDGTALATLAGHDSFVWSVAFTPKGNRILTASTDGTARVWDPDGTLLATFSDHVGFVSSAVASPDGSLVLTAGSDGTARLWPLLSLGEALTEVQQRLGPRQFTESECSLYRIEPCPNS